MAEETKKKEDPVEETPVEETPVPEEEELVPEAPAEEANPWEEKYNAEHDARLRIAAEYDNFRKRTVKEKDAAYGNGKADTVAKFLPIYDNLERALKQPTEDDAFKKGVEMTMNQLVAVMEKLGVKAFGAAGEAFDPTLHNAVMHCEDESLGENVIAEVFQKGFIVGEKVIRFAMVKVAN